MAKSPRSATPEPEPEPVQVPAPTGVPSARTPERVPPYSGPRPPIPSTPDHQLADGLSAGTDQVPTDQSTYNGITLASREMKTNIHDTILQTLMGELDRHGQITRADAHIKEAFLQGAIDSSNCLNGIRVEHDREKQRLRVLAPDPLESYYEADFALTFSIRDGILYVALEKDSRQTYLAFPEGDKYWDNEANCYLLCQPRVRRGNKSLDLCQWARRWIKDFLDHYFSYASV